MTFNSWEFLLFYPIVLLLYFVLPKKLKWPMLLIASYYFYMCYQAELVVLILGTTIVSWIASRIIEAKTDPRIRKLCLAVTLVICLGVLFFYKYFNFLSGSVTGIITALGGTPSPFMLDLVLPVGISFYTFQTLSYVIDVYRGDIKTEPNFFFYALFVSFFPQLVAGPIERPDNLIPQLKNPKPWSNPDAIKGAKHMIVGFFKKICVADLLSVYVNSIYNNPTEATSLGVIIATCLFAVQIYCDFSGYTDIAIGCARVMGIRLMQNFNDPYVATTIKDFWRRWHISLTSWFTDYVYIPLGGSRCKKWRHLTNIMIVFLLSGIWHGAAWTYIIWGVLHGVYQIIGNLTAKPRSRLIAKMGFDEKGRAVRYVRMVITFILVCLAWMVFRANSLSDLGTLLSALFTGWGGISLGASLDALGMSAINIITIILSVIILKALDLQINTRPNLDNSAKLINPARSTVYVCLCWCVAAAWMILLASNIESAFIYFQF